MARIIILPQELQVINDRLAKIEKALAHQGPKDDDPYLDTEQVMRKLNVSRRTLQKWRDEGRIKYSAVSGKFYYRQSAIDEMLTKHEVREKFLDENMRMKS